MEKRANIIKNASAKYTQLEVILDEIEKNGRIENLIIFVSPQQISNVLSILADRGLIFHKLTEKEGTKPEKRFGNKSEREHIITKFKSKDYQAIVAIKCLDEGVNIPSIRTAFILASSTNPKEYVQRRGRVLRKFPGKSHATIFDFITLPLPLDSVDQYDAEVIESVKSLAKREIIRMKDFASIAENPFDSDSLISEIQSRYDIEFSIDDMEEDEYV